jgi:tetratricopeptide (TPR) repeat protein
MIRSIFGAIALALVSHAAPCAAQDPTPAEQEARAIFEAGRVAFDAARYEDALRHFRHAYQISPRPALLYNIGVAADRLRRDSEALEHFERYLREAPADAPQRADALARVEILRRTLPPVDLPDRPDDADPEEDPITPSPSGFDSLGAWLTIGGGALVLAGGVTMLALGQMDAERVEGASVGTSWADVSDAADRGVWMRTTGWVLSAVGLAVAAFGVSWILVGESSAESAHAELGIGPNGISLRGGWL